MNDFEAEELATKRKPWIRFGLLEGIILFLIVCAIGGIVIPNRTSTGSPAPRTNMISQLKQVGLASLMYMAVGTIVCLLPSLTNFRSIRSGLI